MGNHEFCEECGASDFHYNRPCDPERKAKYQKKLKETEDRTKRANQAALGAAEKLKKLGYEAEINEFGDVVINKWSLIK